MPAQINCRLESGPARPVRLPILLLFLHNLIQSDLLRRTRTRLHALGIAAFLVLGAAVPIGLGGCAPAAPGASSPAAAAGAPAQVLSVSPDPIDLGTLSPGQMGRAELRVANAGTDPRSVERVETSCPCVSAGPVPLAVAAGGEGRLTVVFDAAEEPNFRGNLAVELRGLDASGAELFRTKVNVGVSDAVPQGPDLGGDRAAGRGRVD